MIRDQAKFRPTTASVGQKIGEHPDMRINMVAGRTFAKTIEKSLPEGVSVCEGDSVLMIAYTPPEGLKMGNYANPVSWQQSKDSFTRELENTINAIVSVAKRAESMR